MSFLLINIYGSSMQWHVQTEIFIRSLECYKDSQIKAYNITKLANEKKSVNNIQYGYKIYYFVGCFDGRRHRKHCNIHSQSNRLYKDRWA